MPETSTAPRIQSILISGQKVNSRTETLELYCKDRFEQVGVFAFSSPQARHGDSRWTLYQSGARMEETSLPSLHCRPGPGQWLVLPWIFLAIIGRAVRQIRRTSAAHAIRWDCFVGIALVSTLLGLLLRRLGLVRRVVYYCLDYYVPPASPLLERLAARLFLLIDRWAARRCDENWIICDRIAEGRSTLMRLDPASYRWFEVPLGYDDSLLCHPEPDEFDPYSLGFVGSLSPNQGVQGVLEALPCLLRKFPSLRLQIIGTGQYEQELRREAARLGVQDAVVFHGFVADEQEVLRRLSRCAIGLATWTGSDADNARYADPGKPKLYAMCGIPTLITDVPKVAQLLESEGAGRAIPYDPQRIADSLADMLSDPERLKAMRASSRKFALQHCLARVYFDRAFRRMHP